MGNDRTLLTEIGEHIAAVIVIPHAGAVERFELSSREDRCGDWQGYRLVQTLLAGKTDSPILRWTGMLIAKPPAAFHTGSERRVVAAMRD